jgi:transposase
VIGRQLLKVYEQLFGFWKNEFTHEHALSKREQRRLKYLKNKLLKWLLIGTHSEHKQTARTCDNILDMQTSLWRFFEIKGVPPTNNHAERQLRPLVISKKLTFGTQSERGSRFIERIFTVAMSCRQQKREVLPFLVTALQKYFSHQPPPSLMSL